MKREEFQKNLSLYGTDFERWPEEMRSDVLALVSSSPEYSEMLEQEKLLENSLRKVETEEPSSNLAERIVVAAKTVREPTREDGLEGFSLGQLFQRLFLNPAYVFAVLFLAGLVIGYLDMFKLQNETSTDLSAFLYQEEIFYE